MSEKARVPDSKEFKFQWTRSPAATFRGTFLRERGNKF